MKVKSVRAVLATVFYAAWVLDILVSGASDSPLPTCQPEDFHFEYTECDSDGGRWRVSVPKEDTCKGGAPSPPVRGKDCTFTCSPGQFLDLTGDQSCQPCPAGTYSLGGGVRFDDWEQMPDSFSTTSEELGSSFLSASMVPHSKNCSRATWKARGGYVFALPGPCTTTLSYSTKLVKAGLVTFEYQYTDPETIFHFIVQNEQCQAGDEESNQWPDVTKEGDWGSVTVPLKTGTNILQWRVIGALSDMTGSQKPILIRKIEVTGVAFTSECSKCRKGSYSSGGTAFCAPCKANEFSGHGDAQCTPCQEGFYSEPGSSSCVKRPPCTKHDYYKFQTPCDENNQTRKVYKWIEPQTCDQKAAGSVPLPHSTDLESCPPCNLGMFPVNASHCEFCPEGLFSDGSSPCKACPVSTSPQHALHYRWWTSLLPNVSSNCISEGMTECSESAGWQPAGDHAYTSFSPLDRHSFLILSLHVGGFQGEPAPSVQGKATPLGQVRFTFQVDCAGSCEFTFLSDAGGRNKVVEMWMGSVDKQEFVYDVHSNEPLTLSWAFQPMDYHLEETEEEGEEDSSSEHPEQDPRTLSMVGLDNAAKMFSIQVTNALDAGATQCLACPKGTTDKGCVPCPDGQYIDQKSGQCVDCPPNTVLPGSSDSWGPESCKACGEGLKAVKKRLCKSDCTFTDKQGRHYDFTALDGVHYVQGGRLFTSGGTMYYHGFNLTLCNAKNEALPVCVNNVTDASQLLNMASQVEGMVCRSTLIPQSDPQKPLVSTQPVSLATKLTKIVTNVSLESLYETGGFPAEDTEKDVHFYYKSQIPTLACPEGRTTIISLRCDPDETSPSAIQLPPKCSDGTCDGCTFHFAWPTQHACPRCTRDDYDVIRGECVDGEQLIHYYPPSFCLPLDVKDLKPMKQKCQILPFAVMVAIPVALGVGLILIVLLIYCWSRNRKLEYKYSKLVETTGSAEGEGEGELPGVESCAMEEGEEDNSEPSVHFAHHAKGPRLLHKVRQKIRRSRSKDDSFASVRMHEKLPLT